MDTQLTWESDLEKARVKAERERKFMLVDFSRER